MPDGLNQRAYTRAVLRIAAELIQRGSERGLDVEMVWRIPDAFPESEGKLGFEVAALAAELGLPTDVLLRTEVEVLRPQDGPR